MSTTLITRATIVNEGKQIRADLLIRDERIEKILYPGYETRLLNPTIPLMPTDVFFCRV